MEHASAVSAFRFNNLIRTGNYTHEREYSAIVWWCLDLEHAQCM
jgi:hypothetical protein